MLFAFVGVGHFFRGDHHFATPEDVFPGVNYTEKKTLGVGKTWFLQKRY